MLYLLASCWSGPPEKPPAPEPEPRIQNLRKLASGPPKVNREPERQK